MAKLQIDLSGRAGLAPKFAGDNDRTVATPELRYLGAKGQMADGIYNPLRRYGYLSPANATYQNVGFSGGTNDAICSSVLRDDINDDFYFAEKGRQIFRGDGLDDTVLTRVLNLSAGYKIYDLEEYQINGARKMFVVYKDSSGDMDIAVSNFPYDDTTDSISWLTNKNAAGTATGSSNATGSFTNTLGSSTIPFMRTADNGLAYIFQDNNIHEINGTTKGGTSGTVVANTIVLPPNFNIIDAIDYKSKIYAIIQMSTRRTTNNTFEVLSRRCGVYIWNRISSSANMENFIPVYGVKEIERIYISPEGKLRLLTVNSERMTQIREFNGSTFIVIEEPGYVSGIGLNHDALTTFSNMTVWLGSNGYIYAHGRITHVDKEALYKIGKVPEDLDTLGQPGAILFGGANTDSGTTGFKATKNGLYIVYTDESNNIKLKEWDIYGTGADGVSAQMEQGDIYTLVNFLPSMSTVNYIDIYMIALTSTGSSTMANIKLYFNQSSTAWATKTITRDEGSRGYYRIEINKPFINSIQLEIEYPTNTSLGIFDFAPNFAIVDYTPTLTKG